MKLLFDFFPIILFFIAYKAVGIYAATAVAIVASLAQVGYTRLRHGRVERMHMVSMVLILVLGGATLFLQNEMFIKWKPTAVNWAFAVAFLGSQFIGRRPLIARMLDGNITLPEEVWRRLNVAWTLFFVAMGAANLYVVYHFSTDFWVNFKLFGMMGLTLAFVMGQAFYLARHIETEEAN